MMGVRFPTRYEASLMQCNRSAGVADNFFCGSKKRDRNVENYQGMSETRTNISHLIPQLDTPKGSGPR